MMDAILNPIEPGIAHTCKFHPPSCRGAAPTSPTSQSRKAKSFSRSDSTSPRSAKPGPPTRRPLSVLPSVVSPPTNAPSNGVVAHQRSPCLEAPKASIIAVVVYHTITHAHVT